MQAARSDTEPRVQAWSSTVQQGTIPPAAKRIVVVSEEALGQFQKHLDLAKGRFKVGVAPKIDVTTGEVDLSNARLNLITARKICRWRESP